MSNFKVVRRPSGKVWLHKRAAVWVVAYPAIPGARLACWQAFFSVQKVPKGHDPWAVDNRRVGGVDGFPSLDAALAVADQVAGQVTA